MSSIAELRHVQSDEAKAKIKAFDPDVTSYEVCIITSFQNAYYYTESFEEAKDKMRYAFHLKIPRSIVEQQPRLTVLSSQ